MVDGAAVYESQLQQLRGEECPAMAKIEYQLTMHGSSNRERQSLAGEKGSGTQQENCRGMAVLCGIHSFYHMDKYLPNGT